MRALDVLRAVIGGPIVVAQMLFFDVGQRVASRFGARAHLWWVLLWAKNILWILRVIWNLKITLRPLPPELQEGAFIAVGNHQSPLDMALVIAMFGARHPQFVARPGLDRGTPCLSYYLRHGGGVTLRRDAREQNLASLHGLAAGAEQRGTGVLIFAEGRKDHDAYGQLSRFHVAGPMALLDGAPTAKLVPVVIDGASAFYRGGLRVPRGGLSMQIEALAPIPRDGADARDIVLECERRVAAKLAREPGARPRPLVSITRSA